MKNFLSKVLPLYLLTLFCLLFALRGQATETVTYLHTDVSGSPVAATDAQGNVVWRESYRPYGEKLKNQSASASNRQFFHDKPYDQESGLSYFGARYYDPIVGRFYATDPVTFQEGNLHSFNRYAYANNNPYRFVDPDGNQAIPFTAIAPPIARNPGYQALSGGQETALGFPASSPSLPAVPGFDGAIDTLRQNLATTFPITTGVINYILQKAGGGAREENIPAPARDRIQGFADKYGTDVTVVGSRAAKPGGNGRESDYDYIISNPPSQLRKRAANELPRGAGGGELTGKGWSGQDFLEGPVRQDKPHITFEPQSR